jgi:hypothetical protein
VNQLPPRSTTVSPSASTSNWPVLPGVTTASMPNRFLIMAARLAALALLPSHVGQERISIFILVLQVVSRVFPDQCYQCKSAVFLPFSLSPIRCLSVRSSRKSLFFNLGEFGNHASSCNFFTPLPLPPMLTQFHPRSPNVTQG